VRRIVATTDQMPHCVPKPVNLPMPLPPVDAGDPRITLQAHAGTPDVRFQSDQLRSGRFFPSLTGTRPSMLSGKRKIGSYCDRQQ
jgi:hypothetical protein